MKNLEMNTESFKTKYEAFINGCDSIEDMGLWDKESFGEMEAFYSNDLISIIIRIIATDKSIEQKEVDYLNKTFGFDYTKEQLVEVYNSCYENIVSESFDENFENGITYMRKINSKLADAYKELLYLVCKIIIESDGVVAETEVVEVEKLKTMCH